MNSLNCVRSEYFVVVVSENDQALFVRYLSLSEQHISLAEHWIQEKEPLLEDPHRFKIWMSNHGGAALKSPPPVPPLP
jgi:hypothetical protein